MPWPRSGFPARPGHCGIFRRGCFCIAFFSYSINYLIDTAHGVILDVEATAAHRTAKVDSTRVMVERVEDRFNLKPERLIADTAYGTAPMLGRMVEEKSIEPHIPVFDKTERKIARSVHERARDMARQIAMTPEYQCSRCERKKVEMLFAHLKSILKLDRLRLRGLTGANDEFTPAGIAQNLRRMAKLLGQGPPFDGIGAPV